MREINTGCTAEEENEPETYMLREGVGLFVDYFRNSFPDLEEYRVRYLPVIEMLAASPPPLPERAVGEILHRGRTETRALLNELGPLFPISPISSAFFGNEGEPEKFVSISSEYGSALRSWLRSPAAGRYAADERRGHQRLAERGYLRYRKHGPEGLAWAMLLQLPVHLIESGMAGSCAAYLADPRVRERAAELGVSLPEGIGFYFRRLAAEEGERGDPRTEELPVIVLPRDAESSLSFRSTGAAS